MEPAERFLSRVETSAGCWTWKGSKKKHPTHPYGRLSGFGLAHRWAYRLYVGEIPEGKKVLHRCDNTLCVRPDHLFLGTQKENVIDCVSKGRNDNGRKKRTHCPHGHAYTEDNTYRYKNERRCRACWRKRS